MNSCSDPLEPLLLGIEGGGTRTVAILATAQGELLQRVETGPCNLKFLDDTRLTLHLRQIALQMPAPSAIAVGLAGTWSDLDCTKILAAAGKVWPGIPCHASSDLETALAADSAVEPAKARVLVLSGTGSCCFAQTPTGESIKVGSGGHMLADIGSAFQISLETLRGVFARFEETGCWPLLGGRLLRALGFNSTDDLIGWANTATKTEISRLAPEVLCAWEAQDPIARRVVQRAARQLARQAVICAKRLKCASQIRFVLSGSMLLKQAKFRALVMSHLERLSPGCTIAPLERESAWGAVQLAAALWSGRTEPLRPFGTPRKPAVPASNNGSLPVTEARNPRSLNLDKMPLAEAIELMISEEKILPEALWAQRDRLEAAMKIIVDKLKKGGRLLYVGAGTSGRLGVLDASECPPTFRVSPELVQGIIAGGHQALWKSVETAEDDYEAGSAAVGFRNLTGKDVVVGIAASGATPFVWGAFSHAAKVGAPTILVCFNPSLQIAPEHRPDVVIAPDVGPELLTGSTRLKAGTATKLILNIFSTLTMVQLGKVRSNLMIDMAPTNTKLKDRAIRIVNELRGGSPEDARRILEQVNWVILDALEGKSK